jgi:hypothetical protein
MTGRESGGLLSRFECKYLVDRGTALKAREFLTPFMHPDPYARNRPRYRYTVCSLYLDGAGLPLLRAADEGWRNRFKLRLRTYPGSLHAPVYLEVKRRVDGIVSKLRAGVAHAQAGDLLERGRSGQPWTESNGEFLRLVRSLDARPVIRVHYLREAYEALGGEPVRVTFDTDLAACRTRGLDLSDDGRWEPFGLQGVVLEIKFSERFPPWIGDMVSALDLQRRSFCKYALGMRLFSGHGSPAPERSFGTNA